MLEHVPESEKFTRASAIRAATSTNNAKVKLIELSCLVGNLYLENPQVSNSGEKSKQIPSESR